MGSHSVTCHPTKVRIPQVLDLATPEGCKAKLTYVMSLCESGPAGNWTHDLSIASPTPYHSANIQHTPASCVSHIHAVLVAVAMCQYLARGHTSRHSTNMIDTTGWLEFCLWITSSFAACCHKKLNTFLVKTEMRRATDWLRASCRHNKASSRTFHNLWVSAMLNLSVTYYTHTNTHTHTHTHLAWSTGCGISGWHQIIGLFCRCKMPQSSTLQSIAWHFLYFYMYFHFQYNMWH